ncbi:MAG: phosphatase PAP2 family protein [Pirellulales bacterium]|nr:phosphatase PAP2 family protein [Pirellulales bacterium]
MKISISQSTSESTAAGFPRLFILAAVFAILGVVAFAVDMPLARYCEYLETEGKFPGDIERLFNMSEAFGHGLGVLMILVTVFVLDADRRRRVARLAAAAFGSGLAVDCVKMMVARWRPHSFDLDSGGVWDTFCGFMLFGGESSKMQSFPSAHTATAVGLAIGLAWMYPRGRWLFTVFAALVACQRMQSCAHYLSDTLFGAALGCLVATVCIEYVKWFDRFEGKV